MKLIIAGSRGILDYSVLKRALAQIPSVTARVTEVVSGGAYGVDQLGEKWAAEVGLPVRRFKANWRTHGNAAGPIRNQEMEEYADELLALWEGTSPGTLNMIQLMRWAKKPVYLYRAKNTGVEQRVRIEELPRWMKLGVG